MTDYENMEMPVEEDELRREKRRLARRLLARWGNIPAEIARKQAQLEWYRDMADAIYNTPGSGAISVMPKGANIDVNKVVRAADAAGRLKKIYDDACLRLVRDIDDATRFQWVILDAIKELPPLHQDIVFFKYKARRDAEWIAQTIGYSKSNIEKIDEKIVDDISLYVDNYGYLR